MHKKQVDSLITKLNLSEITLDPEIQPRQLLNKEVVDEYVEAMRQGNQFPPVIVYFDGIINWLADGYHRYEAAKKYQQATIVADIQQGDRREAKLFSVGANTAHGFPRTNGDKRRAVQRLLDDQEWCQWSNREIARLCKVSHEMVRNLRNELSANDWQRQNLTKESFPTTQRFIRRNGKIQTMNVANIGSKVNCIKVKHQSLDKEFRIIEAQLEPPQITNERLAVKAQFIIQGPSNALPMIIAQMQKHHQFAENVWLQAQQLSVKSAS